MKLNLTQFYIFCQFKLLHTLLKELFSTNLKSKVQQSKNLLFWQIIQNPLNFVCSLLFLQKVKELASTKYNYTFDKNEQISTFVMAFYDAVLLFSLALNNTIAELGEEAVFNSPLNSTKIATKMWGRTFQGFNLFFALNHPIWKGYRE